MSHRNIYTRGSGAVAAHICLHFCAPGSYASLSVLSDDCQLYACVLAYIPAVADLCIVLLLLLRSSPAFRFKNSRFDVIGGALYFMSIVSTLPRCSAGAALLSATSLLDFIQTFTAEFTACWYDIFMNSYLSLITVVLFLLITLGFAKGGGVGAVSGERQQLQREQKRQRKIHQQQQQQRSAGYPTVGASCVVKRPSRRSPVVGPLVKLRTGGSSTQLMVALLHAGTHLSLAVVLLLLLELGVEICIK